MGVCTERWECQELDQWLPRTSLSVQNVEAGSPHSILCGCAGSQTSADRGHPPPTLHSSPHHSLATLLYSVLVQDEAEDVDLSALPCGEEKSRVLLYIFLVTYFFEIKL